ncbi:MAG: hypothetical protein V2A58_17440 [Planctomycetota bacterium]
MSATATSSRGLAPVCLTMFLALSLAGGAAAQEPTPLSQRTYSVRRWRIVVNDDGEVPIPGPDRTLEQFLVPKFNDVLGTQVDAFFLCLASTDRYVAPASARIQDTMNQWAHDGGIPDHLDAQIRTYIDAARKANLDIFVALRLNDIHDAWADKLSYPLKVKRPDLLIGQSRVFVDNALMNSHWSGFDWSKDEVRKHFLNFITWCCSRYDFDGVELDWFRHPLLFKLGEEQRNIGTMNDFVRSVRASLNEIAGARGKRYLLTTRTMDTPEMCLRTGIDVEQWLKEGLLDMLMIGGGYMPYGARLKEFIDLAHRCGVPAYPCMNHFKEPEMMRTVAGDFFALGADGFYIFNWYGVEDGSEKAACLSQCGDPETLAGLDKRFIADSGARIKYCGYVNPPGQFPVPLVGGDAIELVVGDDVAAAAKAGTVGRMTLTVKVSDLNHQTSLTDVVNNVPSGENIAIEVNGVQLPSECIRRLDDETFAAEVTAPPLVRGVNRIRVFPGPGCVGSLKSNVTYLEIFVNYPPVAETSQNPQEPPPGPPPNMTILNPVSGIPFSLYNVPVGTAKTVVFDCPFDRAAVQSVALALNAADIDDPAEAAVAWNGAPLTVPAALLSDTGPRVGTIPIPADQLRRGRNEAVFTFASNLNGTTKGFDINEALLVLMLQEKAPAQ